MTECASSLTIADFHTPCQDDKPCCGVPVGYPHSGIGIAILADETEDGTAETKGCFCVHGEYHSSESLPSAGKDPIAVSTAAIHLRRLELYPCQTSVCGVHTYIVAWSNDPEPSSLSDSKFCLSL